MSHTREQMVELLEFLKYEFMNAIKRVAVISLYDIHFKLSNGHGSYTYHGMSFHLDTGINVSIGSTHTNISILMDDGKTYRILGQYHGGIKEAIAGPWIEDIASALMEIPDAIRASVVIQETKEKIKESLAKGVKEGERMALVRDYISRKTENKI